jgi:hypothetical protein
MLSYKPGRSEGDESGDSGRNRSFISLAMLVCILVICFSSSLFAVCVQSKRSLYVPAVMDENNSGMVAISVETRPGKGEVFVSVYPTIGQYTQLSERTAAEVALKMMKQTDCDIFMKIDAGDMSQVEGPSAGAAITLLILSALENKGLREDFSVTGTIEQDGSIGEVGAISLKAEAVAKSGKKLFIVPRLSQTDKAAVILITRYYNLTVVEVTNIAEAYEIASSKTLPAQKIILAADTVAIYPKASITHQASRYFENITERMISDAEEGRIVDETVDEAVKDNFRSRLESAKNALTTGNLYTAANTAFLLNIDIDFMNFSSSNMERTENAVDSCLANFSFINVKNKSLENYEMLAAAELRYLWATDRKPRWNATTDDLMFITPKLGIYYDLLFAKGWCEAATDFSRYQSTTQEGKEISFDETITREFADELLTNARNEIEKGNVEDSDVLWHMKIAEKAFNQSRYIAAIIDVSYVLSAIDASALTTNKTAEQIDKTLANISTNLSTSLFEAPGNTTHLWPQLYAAHAKTFEQTDKKTALRLYLFAQYLEDAFDTIDRKVINETMLKTTSKSVSAEEGRLNSLNETGAITITDGLNALVKALVVNLSATEKVEEKVENWILSCALIIALLWIVYLMHFEQQGKRKSKRLKKKKDSRVK